MTTFTPIKTVEAHDAIMILLKEVEKQGLDKCSEQVQVAHDILDRLAGDMRGECDEHGEMSAVIYYP